jgi:transposase
MSLSGGSIWPSFGFAVDPEAPAGHPSVLLKLYIYGYLNRIQSSRRLEREDLPQL